MSEVKEWSIIGQQLYSKGEKLHCFNCNYALKGERLCPNCGSRIIYSGENEDGSISRKYTRKEKLYKTADRLDLIGQILSSVGQNLMGCGCLLLLLIILISFFIAFL